MYSGSRNIEDLIASGYTVDIGKYLRRGWEILKQNLGIYIGITLLLFVFFAALNLLPERLRGLSSLASIVITGPIYGGLYLVAFKTIKQRASSFSDFFRGFNNFLPLFLVNLLTGILIGIGFALLIIPGLYLAVSYLFAIPFVVDRRFDFWEAMETSRKLISKRWFGFFGFLIVLFLINMVGALLVGIGMLVTAPLTTCAIAAAYEDIVGLSSNGMADEAVSDSMV
ncbi:hypothetical protein ACQ4M4_17645 [Leptolyngbya sp. AN02str]|uniref:hypothetical protein n=1 Tax=Leptolyngbya sp. AN02str TaxID=3423363 RepID=UPI003D318881